MLAEKRRLEVIAQLKKCESYEEFSKNLKKYEEKKGKNFFVISSKLNEYHVQRLKKLDEEINQLKEKLKKQFPSPSEQVKLQTSPTSVEAVSSPKQLFVALTISQETKAHLVSNQIENTLCVENSETHYEGSRQRDSKDFVSSAEEGMQEYFVELRTKRERETHLLQVKAQLRILKLKQEELEANYQENLSKGKQEQADKYQKASEAAKSIYHEISLLSTQYIQDGNLDAFKSNSQSLLKEDNENVKILQEHRGWKSFLANLAALIFTAGLAQAGYSIYKGQLSWLKPATDAGQKVENLCTSINTIALTV
ncbi:hypothetical protein [Legionella gratiana]|uniref:hypothetical protein n=1 Tax=Legionella gratiana TaxID=45066 RepID=UPI001EE76412|nr:hypothetical protein [Legionella gratiana]